MILLDDVIQILSLTNPDRWFMLDVDRFQRSQISSALIVARNWHRQTIRPYQGCSGREAGRCRDFSRGTISETL
jgi:hypothetical protein